MLEHVPEWLGRALKGVRAGAGKLTVAQAGLAAGTPALRLGSPAFADGAAIPIRFTADGEGVSPPLIWGNVPPEAAALALIVEDADAPLPQPLVHALVWGLPAENGGLGEGAIRPDGDGDADGTDVGRNSFLREGWLPPDPPTGHGEHRYVFQLFALSAAAMGGETPGRAAMIKAIRGNVLAAGLLTGTYSRGQPAMVGPAAAVARAKLAR
ncbi:MAG: YbhB/YbcL family Raf kinase inhibitor-like protein [Allosphingosinicella sp.]|uniref:YbhB/YbcL family Raf kinase inhibitor-like protein n=1 Tax=Allosphingosinicella sp. TaxID=2823234 RepID=UPI0039406108